MAPRPAPPGYEGQSWESDEIFHKVKSLVIKLRRSWKRPIPKNGRQDELTHMLSKTLVGLEIEILKPGQIDMLNGTVAKLYWFDKGGSVYCRLWENKWQTSDICLTEHPFRLTDKGTDTWKAVWDEHMNKTGEIIDEKQLESTTKKGKCGKRDDDKDTWMDDNEMNGFVAAWQAAILRFEQDSDRAKSFWPMPSTAFMCWKDEDSMPSEALEMDNLSAKQGDGEPRDRLLVPANVGGVHWVAIVVDLTRMAVIIYDSLIPKTGGVVDEDNRPERVRSPDAQVGCVRLCRIIV